MASNFVERKIEYAEKIRQLCPNVSQVSGIYAFTRVTEEGIRFCYVGQAVHLLERLVSHLQGFSEIDNSIRKHGLYSKENPCGYKIHILEKTSDLDEKEKFWIMRYVGAGFQLKNKTLGGQGQGKTQLREYKESRGYHDGLKQGYKNAQRFIAKLFEKNLVFSVNGETNKNKEKALKKFKDFLEGVKNEKNEETTD